MNALDAFALACLIIAGGCALAVFFGIVERIVSALAEGRGIFDRSKRRKH